MPRILYLGDGDLWSRPLYGAQIRSVMVAEGLAKAFDVTYACHSRETPSDKQLAEFCSTHGFKDVILAAGHPYLSRTKWGSPWETLFGLLPRELPADFRERVPTALVQTLQSLNAEERYDLAWAYRPWRAEAARAAGISRIVLDQDDFEQAHWYQALNRVRPYRRAWLHRIMANQISRYERHTPKRFTRVTVSKPEDISLISAEHHARVSVVPNGVNLPADVPPKLVTSSRVILFVGILDYPANVDAIQWFAEDVLPLIKARVPDVKFVVAGRDPVAASVAVLADKAKIELVRSPQDLSEYYTSADVVVAPIRLGHGTRLKVLEALSYRRPLVATTEAIRGHSLTPHTHLLTADDAEAFSSACLSLIEHPRQALELANAGRVFVEEHSTWTKSGEFAILAARSALEE